MAVSRAKQDWTWKILLAVAVLLLLPPILTAIYAIHTQREFSAFIADLSRSTLYAYQHGCLTVEDTDGRKVTAVESDDIYYFYRAVSVGGRGRPRRDAPSSGDSIRLTFGNGAWVQLLDTAVKNSRLNRDRGLFIQYHFAGGGEYSFDTDRLTLEQVRTAILY